MKLTDKVKQIEIKKEVSEKELRKFFESLDYDLASISINKLRIIVKFHNVIKIKDYPFPTKDECEKLFDAIGIEDLILNYNKNDKEYFKSFEFTVNKNKMFSGWYK